MYESASRGMSHQKAKCVDPYYESHENLLSKRQKKVLTQDNQRRLVSGIPLNFGKDISYTQIIIIIFQYIIKFQITIICIKIHTCFQCNSHIA